MGFKQFRHCIREKEMTHTKFEIIAETPHRFHVRFPEYDYLKDNHGLVTEFNRQQLLLFLLAYDEKQCLEFMEVLHTNMGSDREYIEHLSRNPAFAKVQKFT